MPRAEARGASLKQSDTGKTSPDLVNSVRTKTSKYGVPVLLENTKRTEIAFFFESKIRNPKSKIVPERGFRSGTK
jgi:hypothetical protein